MVVWWLGDPLAQYITRHIFIMIFPGSLLLLSLAVFLFPLTHVHSMIIIQFTAEQIAMYEGLEAFDSLAKTLTIDYRSCVLFAAGLLNSPIYDFQARYNFIKEPVSRQHDLAFLIVYPELHQYFLHPAKLSANLILAESVLGNHFFSYHGIIDSTAFRINHWPDHLVSILADHLHRHPEAVMHSGWAASLVRNPHGRDAFEKRCRLFWSVLPPFALLNCANSFPNLPRLLQDTECEEFELRHYLIRQYFSMADVTEDLAARMKVTTLVENCQEDLSDIDVSHGVPAIVHSLYRALKQYRDVLPTRRSIYVLDTIIFGLVNLQDRNWDLFKVLYTQIITSFSPFGASPAIVHRIYADLSSVQFSQVERIAIDNQSLAWIDDRFLQLKFKSWRGKIEIFRKKYSKICNSEQPSLRWMLNAPYLRLKIDEAIRYLLDTRLQTVDTPLNSFSDQLVLVHNRQFNHNIDLLLWIVDHITYHNMIFDYHGRMHCWSPNFSGPALSLLVSYMPILIVMKKYVRLHALPNPLHDDSLVSEYVSSLQGSCCCRNVTAERIRAFHTGLKPLLRTLAENRMSIIDLKRYMTSIKGW